MKFIMREAARDGSVPGLCALSVWRSVSRKLPFSG